MKKYMIKNSVLASLLAIASLSSCTDSIMDDINRDRNHPENVPAKFLLTEVITSTAFNVTGGDFSLYASVYIEHETGIFGQMYNADIRNGEPNVATTYNNAWNNAYANIKTLKIAIDKLENDPFEQGNNVSLGIAKVLLAYNGAILTDLFGDVPFVQAGEINPDNTPKYMQPKIDKQEEVYKEVFQLLDDAVIIFDKKDEGSSGAIGRNDYIYGGDAKIWKKAAYALKARYMLHVLDRSADKDADMQTILTCVDNSFTSAKDELKFAVYNGSSQLNPYAGFTMSRDAMGASKSLVDKMIALNDPRAKCSFMQCTDPRNYTFEQITDPAKIETAPNGEPVQTQFKYSYSMPSLAASAPTQLMSYHELMFIKAEVLARKGQNDDAYITLKSAIEAAFANLQNSIKATIDYCDFTGDADPAVDLSKTVADAYHTALKAAFDTDPLRMVMLQKYLSFFGSSGESVEAYNDYRRLKGEGKEDYIDLKNPLNVKEKFPLRYGYGQSDVSANQEVKKAFGNGQYVYTEPVWWAGGTR